MPCRVGRRALGRLVGGEVGGVGVRNSCLRRPGLVVLDHKFAAYEGDYRELGDPGDDHDEALHHKLFPRLGLRSCLPNSTLAAGFPCLAGALQGSYCAWMNSPDE